ncbi:hypothetical protein BJX68DRAFT_266739 [Aspergillus pseudodeflectus]|uniref:Uncharacterized protein n=1 Tax=Aspergillus pseudodeflectus TaxID=176178 RepID=A0ABR4KE25_9EURO
METARTANGVTAAADDMGGLIAGTASLSMGMLSRGSKSESEGDVLQAVHTSSEIPTSGSYDDTGALAIHKGYYKPNSVASYPRLVGVEEVPELSEVQPVCHPAFASQFVPESISRIAEPLLEFEIDSDSKYAGWSPGSTSVAGYGRDVTFWLKHCSVNADSNEDPRYAWLRSQTKPLLGSFIDQAWGKLLNGLEEFTERKGFDAVRELIGPSDYAWLDPDEQYKLRHQITDLLGAISTSVVPSLDVHRSITHLAYHEKLDPSPTYAFGDFMRQMLLAREATLRIQRDSRRWYGGITLSVLFDMIAADRWARNMILEPAGSAGYKVSPNVLNQQLDGLLTFVDEMQWPFGHEVHEAVAPLRGENPTFDISLMDWVAGFIIPGATYPLALISSVYNLSKTLKAHAPTRVVHARQGNYGIVFPRASYWHARSVVGKVLAPLSLFEATDRFCVRCLGGWIGPCLSSEEPLPDSTFGLLISVTAHPPTFPDIGSEEVDSSARERDHHLNGAAYTNTSSSSWTPLEAPPELFIPCIQDSDPVSLHSVHLTKAGDMGADTEESTNRAPTYNVSLDFHLSHTDTAATFTLKPQTASLSLRRRVAAHTA